uniref:outer membrane protein n=1 Tax=Sphingomonas sp. TaxID=28214 RepID=UPI0025EA02EB|nr:outer membrane beta-barrel protein [Sphingomonas sp.]
MRNLFLASCAILLPIVAAPAMAQDAGPAPTDMSTTETRTVPATSFRGIRIEGNVGGDRFQSQGVHNDKLGYGGTIGFDGMIGNRIVIGPEGSYWRADGWTDNNTAVNGGTLSVRSFEEYGVAVRAGVLVTPQLLVFGKGGYVNNEQRSRFTAPLAQNSTYQHFGTDGYQVGGGAELSMANHFSGPLSGLYVSGQYVYSDYHDHTSRQRVMLGVGLRFK